VHVERSSLARSTQESTDDKDALIARCRLAEARRWFAHRRWAQLPRGTRGQSILRWGADQAWLAASRNPQTSVRRWCRKWAPWLTVGELNELIAYTNDSNKRWSADQCALVLGISVADRTRLGLRHLGADDDPNFEVRLGIERAKAAERARRHRAKHSTGAKRGRPALKLSPAERLARSNDQAAVRMKRLRALRKNASRHIKKIDGVTELSVTRHLDAPAVAIPSLPVVAEPISPSRAPSAPRRLAPIDDDLIDVAWTARLRPRATPALPHFERVRRELEI
jgi:hypothetical protein